MNLLWDSFSPRGGRKAVDVGTQRSLGWRSQCMSFLMPGALGVGKKGQGMENFLIPETF